MSRARIRLEYLKDRRAGLAFDYDVPAGTARRHVFDYCALYASGLAEAIAVKPEDRVDHEPKDGRPSLAETVHRSTFEEGIGRLDQFHVLAARKGEKFALARYRTDSGGHRPAKPLERVEIDEWQVDLMTLLVEVGVWKTLTPKEMAAVERSRLWCTAAIDVASRCILAAKLHDRDPCGDTAVEVLELALGDKSRLADQVGAASSWPYGGKIDALVSDNGSAYRSARFMTAAFDAFVEIVRPEAGQALRRPHIERFFGTLSTQFLHWYHGRTFSDYLRKGDHDPQAEATVCADAFAKGFLRQLIDVYHNTPHSELAGQTPHAAWMRLANKHGAPPAPGPKHMRRAFGLEFRRKVDKRGLRFLGLQYNSSEVQEHFGKELLKSLLQSPDWPLNAILSGVPRGGAMQWATNSTRNSTRRGNGARRRRLCARCCSAAT